MKHGLGILAALVFSLVVVFLWGRMFFEMFTHPVRAFEVIVLPSLGILFLFVLLARLRGRKDHTQPQ